MRNVRRVHLTDIWSWYRVELRVGDPLGRSEELVSRCVECDLAEPESLASLGGSAPGVVDGILSHAGLIYSCTMRTLPTSCHIMQRMHAGKLATLCICGMPGITYGCAIHTSQMIFIKINHLTF